MEELLLVRGVTWDLLFGTDRNRNGILDADEQQTGGQRDLGWSAYLTVYSREQNVDSTGQPRIYINDANTSGLYDKLTPGLRAELPNFLILYRSYGPNTIAGARGTGMAQQPVGKQAADFTRNDLPLGSNTRARRLSSIFELVNTEVLIPAR